MEFKFFLLVIAIFATLALCQQREEKAILDDFTIDQASVVVIVGAAQNPGDENESTISGPDASIAGGFRTLYIRADANSPNSAVFSTNVSEGAWTSATPSNANGFALYQIDGTNNGIDLNTSGLGGLDFTFDGADSIQATVSSDFETIYEFFVYPSGSDGLADYNSGDACTASITVPGNPGIVTTREAFFDDFVGNCDFTDVGAFEIRVDLPINVDTQLLNLVTFGEIAPSASPTPSPSTTPSDIPSDPATPTSTPTPTLDPSPSGTPSSTPTPSTIPEPETCTCTCPLFECQLIFATPGDDDDGEDDNNGDSDDDDNNYDGVLYDDDDDFDNNEVRANDDDDYYYLSDSSASVLSIVSALSAIVVVAVIF